MSPNRHLLSCLLGIPVLLIGLAVLPQSSPVFAQGAPTATQLEMRSVPAPNLSGMSPDIRRRIVDARSKVDTHKTNPGPVLADSYGELGKLYLHFGFVEAAEPAFENAARLDRLSGNSPWTYYLAVAQEEAGDLQAAAQTLRRVLAAREGNLPSVLRLARVLLELGQGAEAKFLFEAALQSPLGKAAGYAGLGQLALDARKPALAAEHFENALKEQPEATALRFSLGMAYRDLGRSDEARVLLADRDGQEVRFPDPLMIQMRLQMQGTGNPSVAGGLAAKRGEMEKAADEYRKSLEANPKDLQARRSLAATLFEMRDFNGAEKQYRIILQQDPENASAYAANLDVYLGELAAVHQHAIEAIG